MHDNIDRKKEKIEEILGDISSLSSLVLLINLSIDLAKKDGMLEGLYMTVVKGLWNESEDKDA